MLAYQPFTYSTLRSCLLPCFTGQLSDLSCQPYRPPTSSFVSPLGIGASRSFPLFLWRTYLVALTFFSARLPEGHLFFSFRFLVPAKELLLQVFSSTKIDKHIR